MMMMGTGQISERRVVDGAILAMRMTMTTARGRRTRRAVRNGPVKRREQMMGKGKGKGKGKDNGKGKGIVKLYVGNSDTEG
jgi:hypothetical protein